MVWWPTFPLTWLKLKTFDFLTDIFLSKAMSLSKIKQNKAEDSLLI